MWKKLIETNLATIAKRKGMATNRRRFDKDDILPVPTMEDLLAEEGRHFQSVANRAEEDEDYLPLPTMEDLLTNEHEQAPLTRTERKHNGKGHPPGDSGMGRYEDEDGEEDVAQENHRRMHGVNNSFDKNDYLPLPTMEW